VKAHRPRCVMAVMLSLFLLCGHRALCGDALETIVLVRHGEKPNKGLGQLPSQQKQDAGVFYDYVRPFATVEPSAIFLACRSMPA
jgi:hypothetical protein